MTVCRNAYFEGRRPFFASGFMGLAKRFMKLASTGALAGALTVAGTTASGCAAATQISTNNTTEVVNCTKLADCGSGQTCVSSVCTDAACTSNANCTEGRTCVVGVCLGLCSTGDDCPLGLSCMNGVCVSGSCGDGTVDDGEECDAGDANNDTGACTSLCRTNVCGDGNINIGVEACDTAGASDICNADCTLSACGDGIINGADGEVCDDGNTNNGDYCSDDCSQTFLCGDGIVQLAVEQCDDGANNAIDGACQPDCTRAGCGDGIKTESEACDDGNTNNNDDCTNGCTLPVCGDGLLHNEGTGSEACDDGDLENNDACTAACVIAVCGDGIVFNEDGGTEACDDANNDNQDDCTNSCEAAVCGDGIVQTSGGNVEACDNGNLNSDTDPNACRTNCAVATCGDGVQDTGEACDNGGANSNTNPDACRTDCTTARCGDTVTDTGETCDDGNMVNTDACTNACQTAVCGDSIVQAGVDECDDGNMVNTDACTNTCTNAVCGDGIVQTMPTADACDDGNDGNQNNDCLDGCTLPTCGDGFVHNQGSGTEECDTAIANSVSPGLCLACDKLDELVWLDGQDGNTMEEAASDPAEDGDDVITWLDKSGNSNHALQLQPNAEVPGGSTLYTAAPPSYVAAQNGLLFNRTTLSAHTGGEALMLPLSLTEAFKTSGQYEFFVVFAAASGGTLPQQFLLASSSEVIGNSNFEFHLNNGSTVGSGGLRAIAGDATSFVEDGGTNQEWVTAGQTSAANATDRHVANMRRSIVANRYTGRVDETVVAAVDGMPTVVYADAATEPDEGHIHLGRRADTQFGLAGHVYEVLMFNRELTSGERTAVDGYLKGKWTLPTCGDGVVAAASNEQPICEMAAAASKSYGICATGCGLQPTLRMWLDGKDINGGGAQPGNGVEVTTWVDKSAWGNDGDAFTHGDDTDCNNGDCPVATTTETATVDGVSITSNNGYFIAPATNTATNFGWGNTNGHEIFFVAEITDTSDDTAYFLFGKGAGGLSEPLHEFHVLSGGSGTETLRLLSDNTSAAQTLTDIGSVSDDDFITKRLIFSAHGNGTGAGAATATASVYDDDSVRTVTGGPGAGREPPFDQTLRLGRRGDGTFPLRGVIHEVLVFDNELDSGTRDAVLLYLRDRWTIDSFN